MRAQHAEKVLNAPQTLGLYKPLLKSGPTEQPRSPVPWQCSFWMGCDVEERESQEESKLQGREEAVKTARAGNREHPSTLPFNTCCRNDQYLWPPQGSGSYRVSWRNKPPIPAIPDPLGRSGTFPGSAPCPPQETKKKLPYCASILPLKIRDVLFVAASPVSGTE